MLVRERTDSLAIGANVRFWPILLKNSVRLDDHPPDAHDR